MALKQINIVVPKWPIILWWYIRWLWAVHITKGVAKVTSAVGTSNGVPVFVITIVDKKRNRDILICHSQPTIEDVRDFRERIDQFLYLHDRKEQQRADSSGPVPDSADV